MGMTSDDIRFQPVLYAMVESHLKLIVTCGTMRERNECSYIDVKYYPQMDPENLTEEMSDAEKEFWMRVNSTPPPLILRNRRSYESVVKIAFAQQVDGRNLNVMITDSGDGFKRDISLLRRSCGDVIAGREYQVLYELLKASVFCPQLDRDANYAGKGEVANVVLYLERSLSRELNRNLLVPIDTSSNQFTFFAERPLREI